MRKILPTGFVISQLFKPIDNLGALRAMKKQNGVKGVRGHILGLWIVVFYDLEALVIELDLDWVMYKRLLRGSFGRKNLGGS